MNILKSPVPGTILIASMLTLQIIFTTYPSAKHLKMPKLNDAGRSLLFWTEARVFPGDNLPGLQYVAAYNKSKKASFRIVGTFPGSWEAMGPKNFGGRTLTVVFNPQNPSTVWAGTASGGIWRSYSEADGANAWHEVETGFPVIGVAAVAINPSDSNEIYIGTGEVYNYQNTGTGFAVRTTRGTYGIGILKSTNGGQSWTQSLTWQLDDLTGVQDIIINPLNSQSVLAATTEGVYKSNDSGSSWAKVLNLQMAVDLEYKPGDTTQVFVSCGNSGSTGWGIYKSMNGGNTWSSSSTGLPSGLTGKIMFDISESNPNLIVASVADQLAGYGLYRSLNSGNSWSQINGTDFQLYQGWYSHDVIIDPFNPQNVLCTGINVWRSTDGGVNINEQSFWYNWDFNAVIPGGSEGPADYVHADIHGITSHPYLQGVYYFATDGGVFRTWDGGITFEGANGGFQCQQFYANFSNSMSDSLFAIGGMQDNATAIFEGNPGWRRQIGGDGVSTAISPIDDDIVFGSSQYLNLRKSTNKANSFGGSNVPGGSGVTCFAGPFEMCRSNPNVMYAGRTKVYKSNDQGDSWFATNSNIDLDGNPVLTLEVSAYTTDRVYASTAPVVTNTPSVFRTDNGGNSWVNITNGLPLRYIMDLVVNPSDDDTVFAVISGFGTPHLYRSVNAGNSWQPFGTGLPDVPANCVFIDGLNPNIMYLGNDIGVYVSIDAGATWQPFNDGLTDATFVMHISYTSMNRKLRIATHGSGVYQRDMLPYTITGIEELNNKDELICYPNPAVSEFRLKSSHDLTGAVMEIVNVAGEKVKSWNHIDVNSSFSIKDLPSGNYIISIIKKGSRATTGLVVSH